MSEAGEALARLLDIMARLRAPQGGCPWDLAQSFETIAPYTIEEAYEVADAIARGSPDRLRAELGDLLFQVVFHARLAEERGWFDFGAVVHSITGKLTARHPHVFGAARIGDADEQSAAWEAQKAAEREAAGDHGALADVPLTLPALTRAVKLGRRAARVGFDWPDAGQVRAKVQEELAETDLAVAQEPPARHGEEIGDLLLAVANWARHLGVDPEAALRSANRRFEVRFRSVEQSAAAAGDTLETLDAAQWDRLWAAAKAAEAAAAREDS